MLLTRAFITPGLQDEPAELSDIFVDPSASGVFGVGLSVVVVFSEPLKSFLKMFSIIAV